MDDKESFGNILNRYESEIAELKEKLPQKCKVLFVNNNERKIVYPILDELNKITEDFRKILEKYK